MTAKWVSIPNILSGFRLFAAPFLLYLSWMGHANLFLVLLALSLLSDSIDGYVARRMNEVSEIGTKLDSWSDLSIYLTVPLCAWWLWPEVLRRESFFVLLVMGAYIIPLMAGFIKFQKLPSYHTWAAKTAAVLMSVAVFILFIFDISWPFYCAAIVQAFVACEEVAITIRLSKLESNIRSYWHLIKQAEEDSKNTIA
jgi:CDP-diacylglycerol--glycerol-3-phosphate 3-phosphatidyltransferase